MKFLTKSLFVLGLILLSSSAFSQFSKSSCETLLASLEVNSYQKIRVITTTVSDASTNIINFDVASFKYFLGEEIITLKDANGLNLYIPYNKIKLIKTAPKSGSEFSNLTFFLAD